MRDENITSFTPRTSVYPFGYSRYSRNRAAAAAVVTTYDALDRGCVLDGKEKEISIICGPGRAIREPASDHGKGRPSGRHILMTGDLISNAFGAQFSASRLLYITLSSSVNAEISRAARVAIVSDRLNGPSIYTAR